MSLSLGNGIAVSTNFIKSNPAVPVYNGEKSPSNLYAVIYHIEIGYNEGKEQKVKQYIILAYKDFDLSSEKKDDLLDTAKKYCEMKDIPQGDQLEITLLDNDEAEDFLEKVFNNMKVIRGLITKRD